MITMACAPTSSLNEAMLIGVAWCMAVPSGQLPECSISAIQYCRPLWRNFSMPRFLDHPLTAPAQTMLGADFVSESRRGVVAGPPQHAAPWQGYGRPRYDHQR